MEAREPNKTSVLMNMLWRFAERCGAQGVAFIVSIILARLLDPTTYGTIALITVITTVLQVFVDSGLGNAVIQKKNADDLDFSSVFYFNIIMCTLLYGLMFVLSPYIARFYKNDELTPLIRVLSLTLVFSGVKNVQQAYVSRNFLFKKFFVSTLAGTIGAAVIGIYLAYKGYGVWALVIQQIFNVAVDTVVLWITVKWRPKFVFSLSRLKVLLAFGWKLFLSVFIDTIYNNVRQFIIGKMYSSADLAYYNRGKQFPNIIVTNINTSIESVLLPTMARAQDDPSRVKAMTRRSITTSIYVMAPMMMGMAFVADTMIRVLLTDKWLECALFLRIFCITYMFYPIHTANLKAIVALGRSDLNLKLEIQKKIVGTIFLLATMWFGVKAMAYSLLASSIASQIINTAPNKKLLDYGYFEQLKDIMPSILLAVTMGLIVMFVAYIPLPDIVVLCLQIVIGILVYVFGSIIFKVEAFYYMKDLLKQLLKRK